MSVAWYWPDWQACSNPPAESCSDAGCPVHGDGENWYDGNEDDE